MTPCTHWAAVCDASSSGLPATSFIPPNIGHHCNRTNGQRADVEAVVDTGFTGFSPSQQPRLLHLVYHS